MVQLSVIVHSHNIKPLPLTCSIDCQTTDGNNGPRSGKLFLVLPDLCGWNPTAALARMRNKPRRGPSSPWCHHRGIYSSLLLV